jgi:hypothetical protein
VCQDDTSPAVNISVPVDLLESVFEAVEKAAVKPKLPGGSREQQDFFVQQNPATKKMGVVVGETYDAMVASLVKELSEVLK